MKLFVVRHGETDWNLLKRIQGKKDTELNATGIMQANQLGENLKLKNYSITKIYSSMQKRAEKTAEIIAQKLNIQYVTIDGLEEMNLGEWEGLTWEEARINYPMEFNDWLVNRRYVKTPKGECYQELLVRVLNALKVIIEKHDDEEILIVTHSAVIMTILSYMNNTPFEDMVKNYDIKNATVIEINVDNLLFEKD